jgi:segregation and condensation protein A
MLEILEIDEEKSDIYEVDLPDFQGPLDLLLSLIEQEELDITKIALARVTDQYLARLEAIKETDPDDLTDFLIIAARLILIKSEVLLPRPPLILAESQEENVGDELARQLILYKKFKEVAEQLRQIEAKGQRSFVRVAPPVRPKAELRLLPGEGSLKSLLRAARNAMAVKPADPVVDEVISPQVVTIGQQMATIWQELRQHGEVSFQQLLNRSRNRIEIIVTLLAVLELIKRKIIRVEQPNRFGDMIIYRKEGVEELPPDEWAQLTDLVDVS